LKVLNIDEIPLPKLIDLRQREKNGEQGITKLRHGYVDKLEDYAGRLAGVKTKSDRDQIQREFENAMKIDVANLKDALKSTKKDLTFSKEFLFCVLGVGAVGAYFLGLDPETLGLAPGLKGVIGPSGAAVTAFGGLSVNNKYKSARKSLLEKHPTAFLYEYM
jgi:hypothetical protein